MITFTAISVTSWSGWIME